LVRRPRPLWFLSECPPNRLTTMLYTLINATEFAKPQKIKHMKQKKEEHANMIELYEDIVDFFSYQTIEDTRAPESQLYNSIIFACSSFFLFHMFQFWVLSV